MFCIKCGREIADNESFCPYCGAKIKKPNSNTNKKSKPTKPIEKKVKPKKKINKKLIIVIACLVAAAIVAVALFFILGKGEPGNTPEPAQPTEAVVETGTNIDVPADAEEYEGHYYQVIDEGISWNDARIACEDMDGHLATITSKDEQEFIANLIERDGTKMNYWLGGTDNNSEGSWEWITGESWSYTNWRKNQPDNRRGESVDGDQDYLQICCGSLDDDRYMMWYDMSNSGVSENYKDYPNYKDTQYSGYVCEWEE